MGLSTWKVMEYDIEHINKFVEFERAMAGNDDELDDDA